MCRRLCFIAALMLSPCLAAAEQRYSLFSPTPEEELDELRAGRPGRTETAQTVQPGHLQFELDLAAATWDQSDDGQERSLELSVVPFNLRIGLLPAWELQVIVNSFAYSRRESTERILDENGLAIPELGVTLATKYIFWGNDGGDSALGVLAFVSLPSLATEESSPIEGGVWLPMALSLPADTSLSMMVGLEYARNEADTAHQLEGTASVAASHSIVGDLGGYVELWAHSPLREFAPEAIVGGGLTYPLGPQVQVDGGVNLPIMGTREVAGFLGMVVRL